MPRIAPACVAYLALLFPTSLPLSNLLLADDAEKSAEGPRGIAPTGPDGSPLNLDFETGDLQDWVAAGTAFEGQPIEGDTVHQRRRNMKSEHRGRFWIGTYEVSGDQPQGTLSSATVRVTHPWASFLVGGGEHQSTRVEIVHRETGEALFEAHGENRENMRPVAVDLREHQGEEIFIRLVDKSSGPWGHINFDHFRFHESKPNIPDPAPAGQESVHEHAGLSAQQAAEAMTLPEGFEATVFAAEPDVQQPIAFTLDDRGRLWVAEGYAYPVKRPEGEGKDRILIFEDTDGDGRFDKRKVFIDGLNLVSGLEVGFGGVWVGQAPELLFIPDRNHDDVPDGEPQVLLDGWGYHDTHETLNAFIWGPDGWLYGCHGVFTHSKVGKPGTPEDERIPLNAGIWRYHPTKHVFEVFARGTSNPWGIDFDDHGQAFETACVIPHLYHVIQGARYQRQAGQHFNPYVYDDIKTIADHLHYEGSIRDHAHWGRTGAPPKSTLEAGGGHAHAGAMIYLGDAWPEKYRGALFMNNIHGARVNMDLLEPRGSGFVGRHGPDFLLANDAWSQILNFRYGPDGQVYLIDWYDANQCHRPDEKKHDRSNGRIFKITYGETEPVQVNLRKLPDEKLVELQRHENDWYVRHARRILQERAAAGELDPAVHDRLEGMAFGHDDETRRLRALWALHVTGGLTEPRVLKGLNNDNAYVRAWTVQLALEDRQISTRALNRLEELAHSDPSQVVRLYLASGLQRLAPKQRWDILAGLLSHAEDAGDHNLPLMYWYGLEPLVPKDMRRSLELARSAEVPLVRSFTLRRIADIGSEEAVGLLVETLRTADSSEDRLAFLNAINTALEGRRQFPMPKSWPEVGRRLSRSDSGKVRRQARALGVTFGDPEALAETRRILTNEDARPEQRRAALESLLQAGDPKLPGVLHGLIDEKSLRREALRGLAQYEHPKTPRVILKAYSEFDPQERRDALHTLAARPDYAHELLTAVEQGKVAATDLSADLIRQLRNLNDEELLERVKEVWGVVRETAEDRKKLIEKYRKVITGGGPEPDPALGRAVFAQTCQQCHKLYGVGGEVGPELTGSNRADLDYLLSNVLDPSAVMAKEYQPSVVVTTSGRVITGIVQRRDEDALTVVTANETVTLPRDEVDLVKASDTSMMPNDLWKQLNRHQVRSLVAYLAGSSQTPLLATPETAKLLFNGRDLTGWSGNRELWSVEGGEIVGRSPGIDHNEFLVSDLLVEDFELTLEVKLVPNSGNSGIQFRSEVLPEGTVRGYQADAGAGWWGKLYEEHGRGVLWDKSGEPHVKPDQWNRYRIRAEGHDIRTWINGEPCVDLHDPQGATRGVIALQIHSGGPMEVRFRNLQLKVLGETQAISSADTETEGK